MKKDNLTYQKAYNFAVRIVRVSQFMVEKRAYVLSNQILKSGTSIGANVSEANGAISNADFSAKISIAYKETLETTFWLCLLKDTDYLSLEQFESLHDDADEIGKILFAILRKMRINKSTP